VETVLKQVSTGVMVLSLENKVLSLNPAALSMLSVSQEEAMTPEPPLAIKNLLGVNGTGPPPKGHIFVELSDKTLSLVVNRAALKDEGGNALGWLITFDDLSELEKAQRLAAWQEVAKRIAHEIKNPLTPISLAAQRLQRRFGEHLSKNENGDIFQECTGIIIRQVESMRTLVNEFSQFARLPEITPKPGNLLKTIQDSLALFRQSHPGLKFDLKTIKNPETFLFDPAQIGRVLSNLFFNSARATNGQGKITIEVNIDPLAGVILTISDDGPGLAPEVRDQVFEPYVTSGEGGQGLGLTIVRTIINDHGGFIRVTDNKPQGTSFIISLPYTKS
jgi:two-component system nitrogen regulation sensor histidine kinase NtrY